MAFDPAQYVKDFTADIGAKGPETSSQAELRIQTAISRGKAVESAIQAVMKGGGGTREKAISTLTTIAKSRRTAAPPRPIASTPTAPVSVPTSPASKNPVPVMLPTPRPRMTPATAQTTATPRPSAMTTPSPFPVPTPAARLVKRTPIFAQGIR